MFTGVSGSGKSSLVPCSAPPARVMVSIDQGAIRGSRRSNPATYSGLLDPIRKAFAKANGLTGGAVQRQLRRRLLHGAGHDGGRIVFEGTPNLVATRSTLTAQHLATHVGS